MSKPTSAPDLPNLIPWDRIQQRLELIFPEGTKNRGYVVRDAAAKTVFVMLYLGAIDDNDRWVRPDQITRMTDRQAARTDVDSRLKWAQFSVSSSPAIRGRWYAVNSRETIRDETLRYGLAALGAVVTRPLPTTSSAGRYSLKSSFADLFNPDLEGRRLQRTIDRWREDNLSPSALARVRLLHNAAMETGRGMIVTFPNGETRRLAEGPSSVIAKAVVEEFAPQFLTMPGIVWLSESANKEDARDARLASELGLRIDADRTLPDLILVDLGPRDPLFVFVEVVATDGAIGQVRRDALLPIATEAGYAPSQVAFVTAYLDRDQAAFKKTFSNVAWETFAWCVSEPDALIAMTRLGSGRHLNDLMGMLSS